MYGLIGSVNAAISNLVTPNPLLNQTRSGRRIRC